MNNSRLFSFVSAALLSASLMFGASVAIAEDAPTLSAEAVSALFVGKTAKCVKTKDDSLCNTYFDADGSLKRLMLADGKKRTGKWWTEPDQLCVHWEGKKKGYCFDLKQDGDAESYGLFRKGKRKSTISGFEDGNTLGF